jgi:hypothetical protein
LELKRHLSSLLNALRQRIVLTPEEKRVLCFVLAAFFLGVTVKHYRETHSEPSVSTKAPDRATALPSPTQRKAEKKQRKRTPGPTPAED